MRQDMEWGGHSMNRTLRNTSVILKTSLLVAVIAALLLPVMMIILLSVRTFESALGGWGGSFEWSGENYSMIFESFGSSLAFTTGVMILRVLLGLVFTVPVAYAFSQLEFSYKNILLIIFLGLQLLPDTLMISGQYKMMVNLGFTDHLGGMLMALTLPFIFNPLSFFLIKSGYDKIDKNLARLVRTEGGNSVTYFVDTIPSIRKEIIFSAIIIGLMSWNSYLWPRVLLMGTDFKTLTMWIFDVAIDPDGILHTEVQAAASVMASLPTIVIFIFMHKPIIEATKSI